jgi:transcriptional regulator with XRE-family HTH domain
MTTYGQRLKHAMNLREPPWTQAELARAVGTTRATINQALGPRNGALNAENTATAARLLNVDQHWLATGEGLAQPYGSMERLALSPRAVYIGVRLDAITDPQKRDRAYALIVQLLDFDADETAAPPLLRPPVP